MKVVGGHAEDIIAEYPYRMKKSAGAIVSLIFLVIGVWTFYLGWKEERGLLSLVGGFPVGLSLFFHFYSRTSAKLVVLKDKILVPSGFLHRKQVEVPIGDIIDIDEVRVNHVCNMRLSFTLKKPVFIIETMMREKDYDELFEHLEKVVKERPPTRIHLPPIEQAALERKTKILTILALSSPVFLLLITRLLSNELQTTEEWSRFLTLGGVIVVAQLVIGGATQYFSKKIKETKTDPYFTRREIKKLKNKWNLIAYSPSLVCIVVLILLVRLPHTGTTDPWPFVSWGIGSALMILILFSKFIPPMKGVISPVEKGLAFLVNFILLSLILFFFYIVININLDSSEGVPMTSFLTEEFRPYKNSDETCYRVAHWKTGRGIKAGDEAICSSQYPYAKQKGKIEFILKEGFLKQPWIGGFQVSKSP